MATVKRDLSKLSEEVVEDILRQHGDGDRDFFDSGRVKEERRHEAADWLREIVGVIGAKDLPPEPSEEEFNIGLRSGIILCKALNKIQYGAVPKVVETPSDSVPIPDGAALIAYQQFENLRNFLVASQEIGLPTFDAPDLQQGGNTSRVVNAVLAMKSYHEWKKGGGQGVWKFGGNMKTVVTTKSFIRKNSEPFTGCFSWSKQEKSMSSVNTNDGWNETANSSLSMLLRSILSDKNSEEIPSLVESLLRKVMEQLEHHISNQTEMQKKAENRSPSTQRSSSSSTQNKIERNDDEVSSKDTQSRFLKQQMIFKQQHKDIKALKQTLCSTKSGMQLMQMKFHEEFNKLGSHLHGLAHAASNYHRVLEENRKLYNEVQDLKGSIRVYCRVRPFLPGQCNYVTTVDHINEGTITINTLAKNGKGMKSFTFNKVFGASATQEEVFADTQPLIRSVLDGYNVCIFAYGQTGSGKTYTMTGPRDINQRSEGVNYRALSDLFLLAEQRKDAYSYDISVQMIEIYNEQVRDLLLTDGLSKRLEIRNSSQTGLNVPDASLVRVSSSSDVIELMNLGLNNRAVGATALNDRSSRSHSCLTVHVQGRDLASGSTLRGCMHLVDLAGSERVDKSEVIGERLKEAQHINKSLSALGDVISSLAQKNSHVPYRNSKLTQLLQDSLGGQAKTLMFVHISPAPDAIGETISTLKFAERVASVELGAAKVNKDSANVKALKEQVAMLKAALARKDGEQSPVQCKTHTSSPLSGLRKPMEELGNIEQALSPVPRNSPVWSSCAGSPGQVENPGWIDKPMVNKRDPLICWSPYKDHNGSLPEFETGSTDSSGTDSLYHYQNSKPEKAGGSRKLKNRNHDNNGSFRSMIPRLVQSPPPPPKGVATRRSDMKRAPKFRN